MVQCYCLPGNPDKLGQHVVGHCPAAESDYVVAQAGLQQGARSHPYTLQTCIGMGDSDMQVSICVLTFTLAFTLNEVKLT